MTSMHYIGAALTLLLICGIGIWSGKKVGSSADFSSGGKKAGVGLVMGAIVGTLIGGSSTIGTAQLAFTYGFSAWWFTLGGGIGCLVLCVFFAKPLYNSNIKTLPQLFTREYGVTCGTAVTILSSIGSFLSIVAQLLSGIALVAVLSSISSATATVIIILLMISYVVFGGMLGAGMVGIAKTLLLCLSVGICGIIALKQGGGLSFFLESLPKAQYFNLFARGFITDAGAGISLVLGILTTQTYIQAMLSAKTLGISKAGAILSAILMPIIGLGGIFVGLYMKIHFPEINSAEAFPLFILKFLPPLLGGVTLATLLVALVGTGAGVALGLGTMISNDIYKVYFNAHASDKAMLKVNRSFILFTLIGTGIFTFGNLGSMILSWSFMSMGLRGAVSFFPLCCTLFLPGKIPSKAMLLSILCGPLFVLVGKFILPPSMDPLFLGLVLAAVPIIAGYFINKRKNGQNTIERR